MMDPSDEAVIDELYPRVRDFAAAIADADIDPDDLLHDALLGLLKRGHLADLERPEAYVRRAVVNAAANRRRGLGRLRAARKRLGGEASDTLDHYPSDLHELFRLTPATRAVLWLVDVESRSFAEASQMLGCSERAARQRAVRGRRQLRDALAANPTATAETRSDR